MKAEEHPLNGKDLVIGADETSRWRLPPEYDGLAHRAGGERPVFVTAPCHPEE